MGEVLKMPEIPEDRLLEMAQAMEGKPEKGFQPGTLVKSKISRLKGVIKEVQSPNSVVVEFEGGARRLAFINHLEKIGSGAEIIEVDSKRKSG